MSGCERGAILPSAIALRRSIACAGAAAIAFACCPRAVLAVDVVDVAAVGSGNPAANWLTAATWSPAIIPNNAATTHYRVGSARSLSLAGSVAVDSLAFTGQPTLTLKTGSTLTLEQSLQLGTIAGTTPRIALERGTNLVVRNGAVVDGIGTISFTGADAGAQLASLRAEAGSSLVLGSGLRIGRTAPPTFVSRLTGEVGRFDSPLDTSATFDFQVLDTSPSFETFAIRGSSIINRGQILLSGGSFSGSNTKIESAAGIANSGLIRWTSGHSTLTLTAPGGIANTGAIEVLGGGTLLIDGTLDNLGGTVTVNASTLTVGGTIVGSVGIPNAAFTNGATLAIRGTYDNRGQILRVDASTTTNLRIEGTLWGGEIQTGDGRSLAVTRAARFDEVAINGKIAVSGGVTVPAGQTFHGTGEIALTASGLIGDGDTRLEPGLTVTGYGSIGTPTRPLVNEATVSGTGINIYGNGITNLGSISTSDRAFINGTYTRAGLGNLSTTGTGEFVLAGTLLNDGATLETGGSNPRFSVSGTIRGGTIHVADGSAMSIPYGLAPVFDGVELQGQIAIGQAVPVSFPQGKVFGNADITLGPPPLEGPSIVGRNVGPFGGDSEGDIEIGRDIRISTPAWNFPAFKGSGVSGGTGILLNHGVIESTAADQTGSVTYQALSLTGAMIQNDGTIRAAPTARVDVYGDLILLEGGTLATSINADGLAGLIAIQGDLDLSAADDFLVIDQNLFAGNGPVLAMTFTGERLGIFDRISPNFAITYGANEVFITAVPEPGLLVISGLPWCWLRRGRR